MAVPGGQSKLSPLATTESDGSTSAGPLKATTSEDDTTAASTALSIPHILKSILCDLHPAEIRFAKEVCWIWRNTIRRSKQVQRAETLTPTTTVLQASGKLRCCVPCYTATILAIHPQLDGWQLPSRGGLQLIDLKRFRSFYMQAIRREFVTSPRWNAVAVKTCHSGLTDNQKVTEVGQHCVVYVRTGVRIADLQNAVEALVSQAISRGLDDEGSELWAELACGNESEAKELDMTKEWDEQRRLPIQIRRWHRTRPMK